MDFKSFMNGAIKAIKTKSGTICAVAASVGVVTTAYFSGKAAVRVDHEIDPDMDKSLKIRSYAKAYWKTVVSGGLTIGAIVASDRFHAHHEAVLLSAALMWKDRLTAFTGKTEDKIGADGVNDIYKSIVDEEHIGSLGDDLDIERKNKTLYLYDPIGGQCLQTNYISLLESLLESNLRLQQDFITRYDVFLEYNNGDSTDKTSSYVWDLDDEIQVYNASCCGGFNIDLTERTWHEILNVIKSDMEHTPKDRITIDFIIPPTVEGMFDAATGLKRPRIEELIEDAEELPFD